MTKNPLPIFKIEEHNETAWAGDPNGPRISFGPLHLKDVKFTDLRVGDLLTHTGDLLMNDLVVQRYVEPEEHEHLVASTEGYDHT